MADATWAEKANSFGKAADEYERARPTYPQEAADWLVPEAARVVLDLGAGTGKFTRSLVGRGREVIAVEPSEGMREKLISALPEVRVLEGTAEELPLSDGSVDAITVAQAWHWVDETRALPEAARVLRPGGTLGLIWNMRDERVDWVRALSELIGSSAAEDAHKRDLEIGSPFGPTDRVTVEWSREMDADSLLELVASRSYIITASEESRSATLAAVRRLIDTDPALAGRATFEMPYVTYCYRATV